MTNRLYLVAFFALVMPLSVQAALVNINTADAALLDTLPGIGPAKAAAIIAYRTAHGPFATVEAIQEVKGIGPSTFANLKASITVTGGGVSVPTAVVQPAAAAVSSKGVQTVESGSKDPITAPEHVEEAVSAPGSAAAAALSGAFVPDVHELATSKWTLFFVLLVAAAGGALMIL